MARRPDRDSPVPLYHQIVETLRYRIATGQLRPGDSLPTLRDAAKRWGVNLHTVRRAYGELSEAGLAVIRRPQGAIVALGTAATGLGMNGLSEFLEQMVRAAKDRFGLDSLGLAELLQSNATNRAASRSAKATFVECSQAQAADYAEQVEARWSVAVQAHCLDAPGEPPLGTILSTFFHFNDLRRHWPHRNADMRFVAVTLDPALVTALSRRGDRAHPARLILAETSAERARDRLADVTALLPKDQFSIAARVTKRPAELLQRRGPAGVVLFAPRVWARLDETARRHPAAMQLRFVIEPSAMNSLGEGLGWVERKRVRTRAV